MSLPYRVLPPMPTIQTSFWALPQMPLKEICSGDGGSLALVAEGVQPGPAAPQPPECHTVGANSLNENGPTAHTSFALRPHIEATGPEKVPLPSPASISDQPTPPSRKPSLCQMASPVLYAQTSVGPLPQMPN